MTLLAPENRKDYLFDLSRWNRAGLSRFEYVDGDAAVWLEELRLAMLGLYLRGAEPADRPPEKWRNLFMKPPDERELSATPVELESKAAWKDVFAPFPVDVETGGRRNERLLEQYHRHSADYAWEMMRAFARAAHIVLGHLDAFANEGYLRTATQWENLRKLAAMVNYQPTPPASATTTVALETEQEKGVIEIARGLAMKYAPPAGGAPLVFETLRPVLVHPELTAARAAGWNYNRTLLGDLVVAGTTTWRMPKDANLAFGNLAVITRDSDGQAVALSAVEHDEKNEKAGLSFDPAPSSAFESAAGAVRLWIEPDDVKVGLPVSSGNRLVIKVDNANAYSAGTVVELRYGSQIRRAVVAESTNGHVILNASEIPDGNVSIEAFTPYEAGSLGTLETPYNQILYYMSTSGSDSPVVSGSAPQIRTDSETDATIAYTHTQPAGASGHGFARVAGAKVDQGRVVGLPPLAGATVRNTIRFSGSPPKTLEKGNWFVAREVGSSLLEALRVVNVREEADFYFVRFSPAPASHPDETEFFGPMTRTLRPLNFDRDQRDAVRGGIVDLTGLSAEARELVKVGRDVIVVHEANGEKSATKGVVDVVEDRGAFLRISLTTEHDVAGWAAGWTKFYLNTVDISHGETKEPKVLGSGDAEQKRQHFQFKITEVSFIPSNAAVTGVAPDMDVTVDGVKWEFRDYGDPDAEDLDAWSVALNEDDTLQIHFRRRLPSGTNNVAVSRHRIGVGAAGTGVPAWSITKPMKKNRFVTGIVQAFPTAGGAAREPIGDIRENAPSKLAANGRAVSLKDFELLCKRHASVWQARARIVVGAASAADVDVVIVPANGGPVTPTLEADLIDFVRSRALPNTVLRISPYQSLPVSLHVEVNVDTDRYVKSDVKDAVETALLAEFALKNRKLGQPLYVAEILAAVERVVGVSSTTIRDFAVKPGAPAPLRRAEISGSLAAVYPTDEQVAEVTGMADITVDVKAAT